MKHQEIWILEDNTQCQKVFHEAFCFQPYRLKFFTELHTLQAAFATDLRKPSLLIADLSLDDGWLPAMATAQTLAVFNYQPTLVVTAFDDPAAIRACYDLGARDYITKPFGKNILLHKVRQLTQPQGTGQPREVWEDQFEDLTLKERQILRVFLQSPNRPVDRNMLRKIIWKNVIVTPKTMDVHLHNLRKKLREKGYRILTQKDGTMVFEGKTQAVQSLS